MRAYTLFGLTALVCANLSYGDFKNAPVMRYRCQAFISQGWSKDQPPGQKGKEFGVHARTRPFNVTQEAKAVELTGADFSVFLTEFKDGNDVIGHGPDSFKGYDLEDPFKVAVWVNGNWDRFVGQAVVDYKEVFLNSTLTLKSKYLERTPVMVTSETKYKKTAQRLNTRAQFTLPTHDETGAIALGVECRRITR